MPIEDKLSPFQPVTALWDLYNPESAPFRFQARTKEEAEIWQVNTRKKLNKQIGFQTLHEVDSAPQLLERVDCGDFIREKLVLWTTQHSLMPVYLLLPKGRQKSHPVVLAFHGHGYGVKDIVGLWENGQERKTPSGYHKDFAIALVRRGFAVAAPEISCFGERKTDFSYLDSNFPHLVPDTCDHASKLAFHLGGSVVGLRVLDGRRLVDFLETRQDLDTTHLGAMGISGGGMHTFFSACLDERIQACVISGYYGTFRDSILAMSHCTCNFVPGLVQFGEMYDLVGLIAPRPLLVESGSNDEIFPTEATRKSIDKAKGVYAVFGAATQLEVDFFEGRHEISGRRVYDFLAEKLDLL